MHNNICTCRFFVSTNWEWQEKFQQTRLWEVEKECFTLNNIYYTPLTPMPIFNTLDSVTILPTFFFGYICNGELIINWFACNGWLHLFARGCSDLCLEEFLIKRSKLLGIDSKVSWAVAEYSFLFWEE